MAEKRAFECFGRLPEYLRTKIYEYACSVSRIVDVQEIFLNPDFPSYYPPYIATHFRGGRECAVISETRPPAILNVSKEARAYTLTKYTAIDEKILSKKGDEEVNKSPVYVNSDVDIVYRGKGPCSTSHAFAMKHECLEDFLVPVAFSKVLAVDIYGIIPHDMAWLERFYRKRGYDEKTAKLMPELEYYEERGWEIAYLARKGVTEIIIILDNDDNMTDFELCDLQSNEQSWTPREKGAYLELERLKRQIHCAWSGFEDEDPELIEGLSIPKITVGLEYQLAVSTR
ncbi:hypothetical protein GLAREA_11921 [Glarea lozoyensis ATCC 20868]|uniref:2EXR domain-containing protein n=1 Tax=Glarea lozoyensis (strain ATCC 20868 / MF5171) TaxID=1116229 RepID=S3D402_GLAL2|nr:uncharacterized protein GLAREA_11921 [Glarea lozoyensis ATCC 20868]EPE31839.1 hypothetical protein GLAREA_11921 [Glarea lozoyensis ATCC 20868]